MTNTKAEEVAWRRALSAILADKAEAKRLIDATNISILTLSRWVSGETSPRKANLLRFVERCRLEDQATLVPLLRRAHLLDENETPSNMDERLVEKDSMIPAEIYQQVCAAICTTPASLRTWSICQLLLRQCSAHLAAEAPLMISFLTCTPPLPGNPIRSLRELAFISANPNGDERIELNTRFLLGAESLVGQIYENLQIEVEDPIVLESTASLRHFLPQIQGAAAGPFLRSGRLSGCLLVASTQPAFFSDARSRLIQRYAEIAALAFPDDLFYERTNFSLALMPDVNRQNLNSSISTIRQRIISLMRQSGHNQQKAEAQTWHDIESEQIKIALMPDYRTSN